MTYLIKIVIQKTINIACNQREYAVNKYAIHLFSNTILLRLLPEKKKSKKKKKKKKN